jgi:hypothetical protein
MRTVLEFPSSSCSYVYLCRFKKRCLSQEYSGRPLAFSALVWTLNYSSIFPYLRLFTSKFFSALASTPLELLTPHYTSTSSVPGLLHKQSSCILPYVHFAFNEACVAMPASRRVVTSSLYVEWPHYIVNLRFRSNKLHCIERNA